MSLIIAIFAVAQIIFAPMNSTIKNFIGSKNTIIFGFTLMTFSTFGLGWISLVSDPILFRNLAVVLRFLQGQGAVLLQVTSYSIITSIFSHDIIRHIGYIEIAVGVGLGMGPTIGSVVYKYLEYEGTMYFFGALNLAAMLVCQWAIPSQLNRTFDDLVDDC